MKLTLLLLSTVGLLQACAFSVHQVHISGFDPYSPKTEGKLVTSSAERFSILGFSDSTEYVDKAVLQLKSRCEDGDLVGVSTEAQTALGFFSWTDRIYLRGTCIARGEEEGQPKDVQPPENGKIRKKKRA